MRFLLALFLLAAAACAEEAKGDKEGATALAEISKKQAEQDRKFEEQNKELKEMKKSLAEQRAENEKLEKEVASQKQENLEARKTEAILREADAKLREADARILRTNEKQTAELRREAAKRQAAPKRQDDVISATRNLIVEEIVKYNAAHNETAELIKLIDSEIRRLAFRPTSKIVRIPFEGTAGASSGTPSRILAPDTGTGYWHSAKGLPQTVWFHFSKPHRLAKIGWTAFNNNFAPRNFRVVGSSDCQTWTTIHNVVGASWPNNNNFDDTSRTFTIPKENRMEFSCLGLIVTKTNVEYVTLGRMMMWEEVV